MLFFHRKRKTEPPDQKQMVFVFGLWRSGTSLLGAMLNQHPDISLMYEADVVAYRPLFQFRENRAADFTRCNLVNKALSRHKVGIEALPEGLTDRSGRSVAVYRAYAARKAARIFGNKMTPFHVSLRQMCRLFPDARFIIIHRNLIDVCRSIISAAKYEPFFNQEGLVLRTLFEYELLGRDAQSQMAKGIRIYEVHHQKLVADPEKVLRSICDWIGVEFRPEMLDLSNIDTSMIPNSDAGHHSSLKSKEILPRAPRKDGFDPILEAKIKRYLRLWTRKGFCAEFPPPDLSGVGEPSALEYARDYLSFKSLRLARRFRDLVLSNAPLAIVDPIRERLRGGSK
jgi:hypothetical protein